SPVNRTALWAAKTLERTSPSFGVISPSLIAADTLAIAREICWTFSMGGRSKWMGRSLRGGMSRSRQRRRAVMSPARASSITFRVNCSASPSSRDSISKVAWLRLPGGRPDGLPLVPLENWPEPLVRLVDICFSFCTRMGCARFAECVFGAYGYLGSKFFRQRTEASSTYLYREGWPLLCKTPEKPCGIGAVLRAGPTLLQADITRGHSKAATSHIYLYRQGWPLPGKCLGNRGGIGDFLRAGPTLLQADITRGPSKAATSQETNANRRITRIEELTIVPTLATYPRLVSFVSSGESDAPAATVWVLKRSDRGSVRRYMEKMTG